MWEWSDSAQDGAVRFKEEEGLKKSVCDLKQLCAFEHYMKATKRRAI